MKINVLLKSLVDQALGDSKPTSGNNHSYYCPKCSHKNRKLEVDFTDNSKGINPWQCNKMLQTQQKSYQQTSILGLKRDIYGKDAVHGVERYKNIKDWLVRMHPESRPFFVVMDYRKHYRLLIEKARNRPTPDCYTEKHHILPKCMNGPDDPENLVNLTAREHFVAHWLLYRAYPQNDGLAHAFFMMLVDNGSRYTPSSFAISEAKEAKAKASRKRMQENNPMKRPELKELQRQRNLGENNFWYSLSEESKEKHREAVRAAKIGALNPNAVKVKYVPTGTIYGSIAECYRAENLKGNHRFLEKNNVIERV